MEVACAFNAWPVAAVKLNASGAVSHATVVTLNVAVVPPIVSVVLAGLAIETVPVVERHEPP